MIIQRFCRRVDGRQCFVEHMNLDNCQTVQNRVLNSQKHKWCPDVFKGSASERHSNPHLEETNLGSVLALVREKWFRAKIDD